MTFLIIWIAIAVLGSIVASSRGRSAVGWFFLSLVFGIFAFLALIALPPTHDNGPPGETVRQCPNCGAGSLPEDDRCYRCGHAFGHKPIRA